MAEILTLHFPDFIRVAGETLQGDVDINIPMAIEDKIEKVLIKLHGAIATQTTVKRTVNDPDGLMNDTVYCNETDTVGLLHLEKTLWDCVNAHYAKPDSHVLRFPFQFTLPSNLPPSFNYEHYSDSANISYFIEVVGSRHGKFHADRKLSTIFSVVPPANPLQLDANAALAQGWTGPWRPMVTNQQIRHGILFGEYSEAEIELALPDLPSVPVGAGIPSVAMGTSVPFYFNVITKTKPVHREDLEHKHGKLFPAPPASSADVELFLHRRGYLLAGGQAVKIDEKLDLPGSLGDKAAVANVRMTFDDPEWTPTSDHKNKGIWKRGVHFEGMMTIPPRVPTFNAKTVEWHYLLHVRMDFPGPGNILELEYPLNINSGAVCPTPPAMDVQPPPYTLTSCEGVIEAVNTTPG